jgi:hypothetical protein
MSSDGVPPSLLALAGGNRLAFAEFRYWPIAADIALKPNVGFRSTADIVRSGHQPHR